MSVTVHKFRVITLVCVLFFLSALPLVALSQEEQGSTTEETLLMDETPAVVETPYELEGLLGDEVFGDFVLGPGKIELEIAPGQSKIVLLTVSNRIGKLHQFDFSVEDMTGTTDGSRAVMLLGDDTGPYTLKDYISIPHMSFDLDHNLRAQIPVTISIPPDAEPGGRYGSVLVQTVAKEAVKADAETQTLPSSAIVSRIGALFFVKITGEVETSGLLKDFSIKNGKSWFNSGPIDFSILFDNTGSVHLNPYGELRITNMFNEEVGFEELEPWFTLPKSVRLREIQWNRDFLYGRYTATVSINRGYDDIVDEKSITFWVLPWKIVLGTLVVLFLVFFTIRGFFRKFEFKRKEN